jgi:short-subunit dehydrogenase
MESLRLAVGVREAGLVVSNAAESHIDSFLDHRLDFLLRQLELGCRVPLALAHEFGGAMSRRQRGGLILMTSLAAFQGTSLAATYAATKAFAEVLGEALWLELATGGVDVVAVAPGATDTPGLRATAPRSTPLGLRPTQVVSDALGALGRGPLIVPGRVNRVTHALLGLVPRRARVTLFAREMRRMYG